jgi:hypothetical protein
MHSICPGLKGAYLRRTDQCLDLGCIHVATVHGAAIEWPHTIRVPPDDDTAPTSIDENESEDTVKCPEKCRQIVRIALIQRSEHLTIR